MRCRGSGQPGLAAYCRFGPAVVKTARTNCVCSGAPCAAVGGFAALRMRRAPLRVVTALYRAIQRQEGTGAPRHSPKLSLRGAKRRGNLAVHSRIVGKPSAKTQLPSRDCHVGRWPPRNDKSGAFAILTAACTGRQCVAGPGCPLPYIGRYGPARLPWAQSALAMTSRERLLF